MVGRFLQGMDTCRQRARRSAWPCRARRRRLLCQRDAWPVLCCLLCPVRMWSREGTRTKVEETWVCMVSLTSGNPCLFCVRFRIACFRAEPLWGATGQTRKKEGWRERTGWAFSGVHTLRAMVMGYANSRRRERYDEKDVDRSRATWHGNACDRCMCDPYALEVFGLRLHAFVLHTARGEADMGNSQPVHWRSVGAVPSRLCPGSRFPGASEPGDAACLPQLDCQHDRLPTLQGVQE
jgi:hypothetical protein